ncbi:MAG: alpha/beta fold hydrolase [Acidimicrobiales bacterium]|jgi:dienelactone hydrolase|nr:alpha/beta fold hydrolase [Acidimicrobiales bacterium]
MARSRARGGLLFGVGALVTAIGVGLLPHLFAGSVAIVTVLSIVAVLGGVALVILGTRAILRGSGRFVRVAGIGGAIVMVAVVTWLVAPPVAATNVPATEITATPADVGLDHEDLTLTTSDGVDLAAWFVPGTNGAGVVVAHGAGSTRSDVLEQSAALAEAGYSVLLVDARGHGGSDGTAMDFGWYGDADLAAAVDLLATRVDPDRIGVVGFSMGGEEAIGAAAADGRIRAVVAEGATGRQADDKAWYSEVYGWRGWLQEQLEKVQFGVADLLTDASPPTPLRAAVEATDAHVLLITAGGVEDEGHAASRMRDAAADRVTVWEVEGAGHTGGYERDADEWRRRVVAFLDDQLR